MIKLKLKQTFNNLRTKLIRHTFVSTGNEEKVYFLLTLLTGILSALIAVGIYKSVNILKELSLLHGAFDLNKVSWGALFIFISGYLTTRYFPKTEGSGIPGVRISLAVFMGS